MNCCKKWILIIVSLFLYSGTGSAHALSLRCYEVFSGKEPDALELFRANPNQRYNDVYQINYQKMIQRILSFKKSLRNKVTVEEAFQYDGEAVYRVEIHARKPNAKRVIITAGVHGNESVTSAAIIELIPQLALNPKVLDQYHIVIYPNMNPSGLLRNRRTLRNGEDYNRTFTPETHEGITKLFMNSLKGERFDLGLDLHEAFSRDRFFIIRSQRGDNGFLDKVLENIDTSHLLKSPTGNYPYPFRLDSDPPQYIRYQIEKEGVATSTNEGTVRAYFSEGLDIPRSYTLESTFHMDLAQRKTYYKSLILAFIVNL